MSRTSEAARPSAERTTRWTWARARPEERSRWPILLAFLGAHLATSLYFLLNRATGTRAALTGLPLDDAWIHLVYAGNLGEGRGFAYNTGATEVGFTSPLWVLLLGAVVPFVSSTPAALAVATKVLGTALAFFTSVLADRLTYRVTGIRSAGLIAGLGVAVDPSFTFGKVSGMEVTAAALAVPLIFVALTERSLVLLSAGFAMGPLARPECIVIDAVALLVVLVALKRREVTWRDALLAAAPGLASLGAWSALCLTTTGHFLPNTFYAKAAFVDHPFAQNLREVFVVVLGGSPWFAYGLGAILVVGGSLWLAFGTAPRFRAPQRMLRLALIGTPYLYWLCVAAVNGRMDGSAFYSSRYALPLLPLAFVPLATALGGVANWASRALREQRPRRRQSLTVAGAVIFATCAGWPRAFAASSDLFANNCENINEMNVALGEWLREHTSRGTWIATNDAGAIRLVSERPTIDLMGLNNHEILFGDRREVLRRQPPRFYAVFPSWFQGIIANHPNFRPVHSVRAKHYTICNCDQEELVVYERIDAPASEAQDRGTPSTHFAAAIAVLKASPPASAHIRFDLRREASRAEAEDLRRMFEAAGWEVESFEPTSFPLRQGLFLFAADEESPIADQVDLALTRAELPHTFATGYRSYAAEQQAGNSAWRGLTFRGEDFIIAVSR